MACDFGPVSARPRKLPPTMRIEWSIFNTSHPFAAGPLANEIKGPLATLHRERQLPDRDASLSAGPRFERGSECQIRSTSASALGAGCRRGRACAAGGRAIRRWREALAQFLRLGFFRLCGFRLLCVRTRRAACRSTGSSSSSASAKAIGPGKSASAWVAMRSPSCSRRCRVRISSTVAFGQVAELERPERHPDQAVHLEAEMARARCLTSRFLPSRRAKVSQTLAPCSRSSRRLDRPVAHAVDVDAVAQRVEPPLRDLAVRAHAIAPQPAGRRQFEDAREPAVIGEQQQALRC